MTNVNAGFIVGRLGADIELKFATSGTAVGKFSICSNKSKKVGDNWEEEGHWFDCVMFGKRAEALQKYLTKGQQVAIHYSLNQDRWQDKETGGNRSKVTLIVEDINLTGGKKDSAPAGSSDFGDEDDDIF